MYMNPQLAMYSFTWTKQFINMTVITKTSLIQQRTKNSLQAFKQQLLFSYSPISCVQCLPWNYVICCLLIFHNNLVQEKKITSHDGFAIGDAFLLKSVNLLFVSFSKSQSTEYNRPTRHFWSRIVEKRMCSRSFYTRKEKKEGVFIC